MKNQIEKDNKRKLWFKNNHKAVIIRYNDEQGKIIGVLQDDNTALDYLEYRMDLEGKSLVFLELVSITFDGYINENNNSCVHKFIKSASFSDFNLKKDSEINFRFQMVDNRIDWDPECSNQ